MAKTSSVSRNQRLEARVTARDKRLFQRAASLAGMSLTEFVVKAAERMSASMLQERTVLELSRRDSELFVRAMLNPPPPAARLRAAAKRYEARSK